MHDHSPTLKQVTVFLFASTATRLFASALLVSLSWQLANSRRDDYTALALTVLLSFVPAFFVPKLIGWLSLRLDGRKITGLLLCALCCMAVLLGITRDKTDWFIATNFLAWIVFLGLEVSWDMWFAQLQRHFPEKSANRLSGATTASSQCALMSGPLLVHYLMLLLPGIAFYCVIALVFATLGVLCFAGETANPGTNAQTREAVELPERPPVPLPVTLALWLVWPILGGFNFMLPVHVSQEVGGNLKLLGVLDASFGLGMAVAGLCAMFFGDTRRAWPFAVALSLSTLPAMWLWESDVESMLAKVSALIFLGAAFGYVRVLIRTKLARGRSDACVGKAVATANAWAVPLLGAVLAVQLYWPRGAWSVPFILVLCTAVLMLLSIRRDRRHCNFGHGVAST